MIKLDDLADKVVNDLRANIIAKDFKATGKTLSLINRRVSPDGFRVLGPGYIDQLENGTAPGTVVSVSDLAAWVRGRNLTGRINPEGLSVRIFKQGTRLWRGVDPRFPGRRQSGVLSEIINPETTKALVQKVGQRVIADFVEQLKNTIGR